MIYNLDGPWCEVYFELNLIEARAAAILTPHLMRHAPAVFLGALRLCFLLHIDAMKAGKHDRGIDKLACKSILLRVLWLRVLALANQRLKPKCMTRVYDMAEAIS